MKNTKVKLIQSGKKNQIYLKETNNWFINNSQIKTKEQNNI